MVVLTVCLRVVLSLDASGRWTTHSLCQSSGQALRCHIARRRDRLHVPLLVSLRLCPQVARVLVYIYIRRRALEALMKIVVVDGGSGVRRQLVGLPASVPGGNQ